MQEKHLSLGRTHSLCGVCRQSEKPTKAGTTEERARFTIRLLWAAPHGLDYVGLDVAAEADLDTHVAALVLARYDNCSDARRELVGNDDIYAELIPNEYIDLEFALPNDNTRYSNLKIVVSKNILDVLAKTINAMQKILLDMLRVFKQCL